MYKIPSQAELTGKAHLNLGVVEFEGQIGAIIDAKNKVFGALVESDVTLNLGVHDFRFHGPSFAINNYGFAIYELPPGVCIPPVGPCAWGTVTYHWGRHPARSPSLRGQVQRPLHRRIPGPARPARTPTPRRRASRCRARPRREHRRTWLRRGAVGRAGLTRRPADNPDRKRGRRRRNRAGAAGCEHEHHLRRHPEPACGQLGRGTGRRQPRPRSAASNTRSASRNRRSRPNSRAAACERPFATTRASQPTPRSPWSNRRRASPHVIGQVAGASGTIHFRPAVGPSGRRQLVAQVSEEKLPITTQTLGSFVVPRPPRPGRAKKLHVSAGSRALSFSFTPPGEFGADPAADRRHRWPPPAGDRPRPHPARLGTGDRFRRRDLGHRDRAGRRRHARAGRQGEREAKASRDSTPQATSK